jgi:hypothetical protein
VRFRPTSGLRIRVVSLWLSARGIVSGTYIYPAFSALEHQLGWSFGSAIKPVPAMRKSIDDESPACQV